MEINQVDISIVMPVYNVERYLAQCLDSIFAQTLQGIEIVAVNDGSTDQSLAILEEYRKKDPDRFHIYSIPNSGVSHARNFAMEKAGGEYILFVDSDDSIEPDMCEKLYRKAKQDGNDIVVCAKFNLYEKERLGQYTKEASGTQLINHNFRLSDYKFELANISPYPWDKLFKRSLLEGFKFPEGIRFEDIVFVFEVVCKAESIGVVEEPLYNYRRTTQGGFLNTFSGKTLDILRSFRILIDYMKENGYYDTYYEELEYICSRHFLFRYSSLFKRENKGKLPIKQKIIKETQEFLDREFPDWRKNHYLKYNTAPEFRRKLGLYTNKDKMLRMTVVREYTPFFIVKILRKGRDFLVKWKRRVKVLLTSTQKRELIKKKIPFLNLLKKDSPACYMKMLKKYPVNPSEILLESKHGEDLGGNIFAILAELTNERYKNFCMLLALEPALFDRFKEMLENYDILHVRMIEIYSKEYYKSLATAGFLVTDTSFPPCFIKREEQRLLNTWHGTPLKAMGRIVPEREYALGNIQRNFLISDYLLYQNGFSEEVFLRDYMIKNIYPGTILTSGYPRNSIFAGTDRYDKIRKECGLTDKQVIVYMPTWRGLLHQKENDKQVANLLECFIIIDQHLGDDQIFYVKLHPYVKEGIDYDGFTHIREFPKNYETYDFLNACDVLVTDYSSIMFDFGVTRRKIILFVYDREEYLTDRGIYVDLDEIDLPKVETPMELVAELAREEKPYPDFYGRFCSYDSADTPRQVCEILLYGKTDIIDHLKVTKIKPEGKKKVLIFISGLKKNDNGRRLISNINSINTDRYDVYVCMKSDKVKGATGMLSALKKEVGYFPLTYNVDYRRGEYIACKLMMKFGLCLGFKGKILERVAEREAKKYFGTVRFDVSIHHSEDDYLVLLMCRKLADKTVYNFKYFDYDSYDRYLKYHVKTRNYLRLFPSYDMIVTTKEFHRLKVDPGNLFLDEGPAFPFVKILKEVDS